MSISQLIASFGYLAVFVLVGAESLGVPLPGETALITAAIYAGHTHRLSPWLIFAVASAGAIVGDNIGYWIGNKGGYRALLAIERRGVPIWAGRWRRVHPVNVAGVTLMHWRRFFIANASGGIIWAAIYTFLGYIAGAALERASGTISLITGIIAAMLIVTGVILLRRRIDVLAKRAEEAYPGPLT